MFPFPRIIIIIVVAIVIASIIVQHNKTKKIKENIRNILHYINGTFKEKSDFEIFNADKVWAMGTFNGKEVKVGMHNSRNDHRCYAAMKLKHGINPWKFLLSEVKPTENTAISGDWVYYYESGGASTIFQEEVFPAILEELFQAAQLAESDPAKYCLKVPKSDNPQDDIMNTIIKG
ncbi:MAG: hypothetical protein ABII64_00330 [Elusimicrobiota bacterium]